MIRSLFFALTLLVSVGVFAGSEVHTQDKSAFTVTSKQAEFTIKLKSNPTTGYSWYLTSYNANVVQPVKHTFEAPAKKLMGAPGYELWTFKVKPEGFVVPQQTQIQFVYQRPWEAGSSKDQPTVFTVTTIKSS